jgi:hypothetical protein
MSLDRHSTKNMDIVTFARHAQNSRMVSDLACAQVSVRCVRKSLARRSDETRIRAGRYKRVKLGWRDTWDTARPRMTNPFGGERYDCRLLALMVPRSPIHAMQRAMVAAVMASGGRPRSSQNSKYDLIALLYVPDGLFAQGVVNI